MKLLNHLFSSSESVAKNMVSEDDVILKKWKDYIETIPKKKAVIGKLSVSDKNSWSELRKLLELELVDVGGEEREESELIEDLEFMEHSQKVRRVHKLEQCFAYAELRYKYVYNLLYHLHHYLIHQMHLVKKLLAGSKNPEKIISHIRSQFELELEIVKKIEGIKTFHSLFLALAKGEHVIRKLDSVEKRILKKMDTDSPQGGMTDKWVMAVFNGIEDKIHELVSNDILDNHDGRDFEFVNRPEFVDYVKDTIKNLRVKAVSERMINVFVHMFREKYNKEMG